VKLKELFIVWVKMLIGVLGIVAVILSFSYPFSLAGLCLSGFGFLLILGLLIYEMNITKGGE